LESTKGGGAMLHGATPAGAADSTGADGQRWWMAAPSVVGAGAIIASDVQRPLEAQARVTSHGDERWQHMATDDVAARDNDVWRRGR
jgi:hypothetical protein